MKFNPLPLSGAYLIDLEPRADERGFFARCFCEKEFGTVGLKSKFIQINDSFSSEKFTLRGLHYQLGEKAEVKVVRCIRGALWDVILDIRPESKTFGQWFAERLTAENRRMMYVPRGFAHGFLTLEPDTELIYFVSEAYNPEFERGIRWDDPKFKIEWPFQPVVMSEKDAGHRDFDPKYHLIDGLY